MIELRHRVVGTRSTRSIGAVTAMAIAGALSVAVAQQSQVPDPPLPVRDFRSPEDTRKTGMKPEEIKAGARPDFTRIREQPVVIPVRRQVSLIGGAGGNIAVQAGSEGGLLVDTGVAESADKVLAAYRGLTSLPIRWIINTSADLDHTGGNEAVGKTGVGAPESPTGGRGGLPSLGTATPTGASIISHEAVLQRMSGGPTPRPVVAWATSTFQGLKKTMYFNNEPIEIVHQPAAHTDGDVMVYFRFSDVIAAGSVFNTDRYPYFDQARGGSMQGVIDALNRLIDLTVPELNMQGGTLVIPGHGRIANEADVVEVRDMATIIRDRVKGMIDKRMTLAQIKAAQPTADYDQSYGANAGPWTTEMFYEALFKDLSPKAPAAAPRQPATRR